ncbi:MAG: flagellar biosynthetic protein FliR [Hyphomicrobiales bacterium]|nr:flagellar biosynthetic protein FliR [Hyphomicrobiales bacterium]
MTLAALAQEAVLLAAVVFCRVGACLMVMPGFSSTRAPMQLRLFIAIAASLAVAPVAAPALTPLPRPADWLGLVALMASELATGLAIGVMARLFFLSLQFLATAAATAIGYANVGGGVEDGDAEPEFATLFTLSAAALFFLLDLHLETVRALAGTYAVIAPGGGLPQHLPRIADTLASATLLALQVVSPFIVLSVILNFLFGVANKLAPQAPVAFISAPFVLAGGLYIALAVSSDALTVFMAGFSAWLRGQ